MNIKEKYFNKKIEPFNELTSKVTEKFVFSHLKSIKV